jgi:nucleoside phosphorylase
MNNYKIKKTSIRWVVALKEEAQIILDHFKLKVVNEKTIYPIYKNEEDTHWLIISGIGRCNSAASAAYLYSYSKASKYTSWINIGIAGSDKGNYGDLYLVDKISTYQGKKNTYPSTMPKTSLPKMHLFTSDFPISDYSTHELIDMEGSAFFDIASKLSSKEFICLMKVISDGPKNDIKEITKSKISNLIKVNLLKIVDVISYYERLSEEEFQIIKKPKLFNEIKSKWHFSETQSHRLETLLRRIETFCNKRDIEEKIKHCGTSNSVINVLNSKIKNNLVDWSKY